MDSLRCACPPEKHGVRYWCKRETLELAQTHQFMHPTYHKLIDGDIDMRGLL